jgi:RNA polymerase sigma-70 factor (ECF subfamily)
VASVLAPGIASKPSPAEGLRNVAAATDFSGRLASLLRAHFQMVWRTVLRLGIPVEAADDAAQEVFIIASRKLDVIELGRERQFLLSTATRVAANLRRSHASRREHFDDEVVGSQADPKPLADVLLDQKRLRGLLDQILESMPEDLRVPFVLFELEGLSTPEIAEILEIPLGTAASRLRRAREFFHTSAERLRARCVLPGRVGHGS